MHKNQSGFGIIECLLIVVVVALIGGSAIYVWNINQSSQSQHQSNESDQKQSTTPNNLVTESLDTSKWKTETKTAPIPSLLDGLLEYKYPDNWSVDYSDKSGHPNFATLSGSDIGSCVNLSISSWETPSTDLDSLLKQSINLEGDPGDYTTVESNDITINNHSGYIAKLTRGGRITVAAIGEIATDPRFSVNKFYATLSSCRDSDLAILKSVAETISYK